MNSDFPKIITEQRKMRKLSQKQAAADLGVSQALLSHYEKGVRECGLDFVVKIADYYHISCDSLLGHSRDENSGFPKDDLTEDIETINKTAAFLLSLCRSSGGNELEKEVHSCIMLNFYKLLRMVDQNICADSKLFSIPQIPAENLTDSVIMNICASIKLKSSVIKKENTDKIPVDVSVRDLIKLSESKISEFNSVSL